MLLIRLIFWVCYISSSLNDLIVSECPSQIITDNICKCHYSKVCTYPDQRACFLMHCTQLANESSLTRQLKRLEPFDIPIDLIISSTTLSYFGYNSSEWSNFKVAGLRMYHNNISNLSETAFKSLSFNLRHFSIMENAHSEATRTIDFRGVMRSLKWLPHLDDIFISVYRIEQLDFNAFKYFMNLSSLSIITSHLDNMIGPNSHEFTSLTSLMLHSNIDHFPNYVFWQMPNLKNIVFVSKNLAIIEKKDFSTLSLKWLEKLTISYTSVETIENKAFESLYNLKQLSLQENSIQNLAENSFANLTKLEVLDLSSNKLTYIQSRMFNDLVSLKILKLNKNQIGPYLDVSALMPFHSTLQILYLGNNKLQNIPLFEHGTYMFPGLIRMDLSYNQITSTPFISPKDTSKSIIPVNLTTLDLSHNIISNTYLQM
ncbi:leucine-rich repeat-containing protein 15-like [Gordionus sp. m RMFG-2023]|uniref:leucine-rich repeat-containing protein 15-like n=1 Tax=Gordionus sp. m RMFG-2023 TaxID=3053472 RepID=UPI0031FC6D11